MITSQIFSTILSMIVAYDCVDMLTGLNLNFLLWPSFPLKRLKRHYSPSLPHSAHFTHLHRCHSNAMDPLTHCDFNSSTATFPHFYRKNSFLIVIIISLSTPLLISCIAHCIIWRKQASRIHNEVQARMEIKLFRTLLLITAIFVLSWLPFQVLTITMHLCITCRRIPVVIIFVAKLLQYSNSFINFVIYCLRMPDYRNALSQMLPNCKCNRNKQRVLYPLVETETGVSLTSYTSTLHL